MVVRTVNVPAAALRVGLLLVSLNSAELCGQSEPLREVSQLKLVCHCCLVPRDDFDDDTVVAVGIASGSCLGAGRWRAGSHSIA